MKTLESFDFRNPVGAGKDRHDWSILLDGRIHQLTEGEDYHCKTDTMAMMARSRAKKRGLKVRSTKIEGGIVIQAYADNQANSTRAEPSVPAGEPPALPGEELGASETGATVGSTPASEQAASPKKGRGKKQ